MTRRITKNLLSVSTICVLAAAISACGGSSSGSTSDSGDGDLQGLLGSTTDTDNDGLSDTLEISIGTDANVFDTDGDGLGDGVEYDELFTNPLEVDTDGDGASDFDEVTAQTDPLDSTDGSSGNTEPAADACDDPSSSNDTWADNCVLKRFGTYKDSSYTRGVQRILWCQNNNNEQATNLDTYADGKFGKNTDISVRAYQTANPQLSVDGVIGPETWTELRKDLSIISSTLNGFDTYSIQGCSAAIIQFYQQVVTTQSTNGENTTEFLGWRLAEFPNSANMVDFSSQL